MRPRNILDWHFEQITCRVWGMMLFPLGGSTTLSVTGSVPLRVAVMGASIDFLSWYSLFNIDQGFAEGRNTPNTAFPQSSVFSTN